MPEIVPQIAIVIVLVAAVALLMRMQAPGFAGIPAGTRRTLALATAGGLLGAPFWWLAVPISFAWTPAPLAFRFLAAAALAFGAVALMVTRRPSPGRVRLVMAMVFAYLAPLGLAVVLVHRDRLDWEQPIAWAFLAIVALLVAGSFLGIMRAPDLRRAPAPGAAERGIWTVWALLFGLWGLGLYALAEGPVAALWLWPADALTSKLIGAMLVTLALMAILARARAEIGRPVALGYAVYGAVVVLASLLHAAAGRPLPVVYAAAIGLAGAFGLVRLLQR